VRAKNFHFHNVFLGFSSCRRPATIGSGLGRRRRRRSSRSHIHSASFSLERHNQTTTAENKSNRAASGRQSKCCLLMLRRLPAELVIGVQQRLPVAAVEKAAELGKRKVRKSSQEGGQKGRKRSGIKSRRGGSGGNGFAASLAHRRQNIVKSVVS
jgi:hypothetical protein